MNFLRFVPFLLLALFSATQARAQSFALSGPVVGGENGPDTYGQTGRTGPFVVTYTGPTTSQAYTLNLTDGGLGGTFGLPSGAVVPVYSAVFPAGTVTGATAQADYFPNIATSGGRSDNGKVTFTATPVAPTSGTALTLVYVAQKTLVAPPTGWDYAIPLTVTAGTAALAVGAIPTTLELDLRSSAVIPPAALTEASPHHTYLSTAPDGSAIDSTTYAGVYAGYRVDVAIFYNGTQIDAELNECNAVNSIISFPLQAAIAAGATDTGYTLVFGKNSATPKCNLANIYWASSNFPSALTTGTTPGTWTVTGTTATVAANVLTLSQSVNAFSGFDGAFYYVPGGNPAGFNGYDVSVQMMNTVGSGSSLASLTIGNGGLGATDVRFQAGSGGSLDFGRVPFSYGGPAELIQVFPALPPGAWAGMEFSQPSVALTSQIGQAWRLGTQSKPLPGALILNRNNDNYASPTNYNFVGFETTQSGTTSLRYLRIRQALVSPPVVMPALPTVPFVLARASSIVSASQPGASVPAWSDAFIASAYQNVFDLTSDPNLPALLSTGSADNVAAINADMIWLSTFVKTPGVFRLPPGDYRLATAGGIRWRSNVILEGAGYNNDSQNPLDGQPLTTVSGPNTLVTYEVPVTNSGLFRIGMNVTGIPLSGTNAAIFNYSSAQVNNVFLKSTVWNLGNNPNYLTLGNGTYPADHTYLPALNVALEDNTITNTGTGGAYEAGGTDGLLVNNNWFIYNLNRTQINVVNHFLFSNNHMLRSGGYNGSVESRYLECSMNRNGSVVGNIGNLTTPRYANFYGWGEGMDAQDDGGGGPYGNFCCQGVLSSYDPTTSTLTTDSAVEPATNGYGQNDPTVNTLLPWATAFVAGKSNVQTQGWNNADGPLYVSINNGPSAGQWHWVVSHTANTVTTDLPFPALAPGTRFSVGTWVLQNVTFDSNQLNDGLIVQLYNGGYGVNFINNVFTNDGPLVLQGWAQDTRFEPVWNCTASGNTVTQPDGYGPSNVALSIANVTGYRGILTMNNHIFGNKLGTHPPWETATLFHQQGVFDGVVRIFAPGTSYTGMEQFGDPLFPGENGGIGPVSPVLSILGALRKKVN